MHPDRRLRALPLLAILLVAVGLAVAGPVAVMVASAPLASAHGGHGGHGGKDKDKDDDREGKGGRDRDRDDDEDDEDDDDREKLAKHGLLGLFKGKDKKEHPRGGPPGRAPAPDWEPRAAPVPAPAAEPPAEVLTIPLLPPVTPAPKPGALDPVPEAPTQATDLGPPPGPEGTTGPDESLRAAGSVFSGALRHLMLIGGVALVVALVLLVTNRRR